MCLIITGASAKIRSTLLDTPSLINDIYTSNPDGIGIMYATTKGLKVVKVLPKSLADATQFITKLPNDDRELAIHFRWTTHGHTDMTNCHPYDVVNGYIAMMHNGVLHTGNAADKSKSDTWHFIRDYLASPVAEHPALVHNEKFRDLLAEFIGDNRFVFMDGDGKMSHVNYDQGIEHDGLWFSNTYAWRPSRLIPSYQYSTKYSARYYDSMYEDYKYDNSYGGYKSLPSNSWKDEEDAYEIKPRKVSAHDLEWDEDDYEFADDNIDGFVIDSTDLIDIVMGADVEAVSDLLEQAPETTINIFCNVLACEPTQWIRADSMSVLENTIYQAFLAGDMVALLDAVDAGLHGNVADVACYYLNWSHKVGARPILPAMI
jgi:hypothetical protein